MSFCVFASPRPCGAAEQRKEKRRLCIGKCRERKAEDPLFPRASFSALRREAESQAGGLPFLLGPFLLASKEKNPRARGGRMDDDDGCCPKTITEVIKHTGFDAYTQKTEPFKEAMNFMTAHQGWVMEPDDPSIPDRKIPTGLKAVCKAIAPIYLARHSAVPDIVQYMSPRAEDNKHQTDSVHYPHTAAEIEQAWTTNLNNGQVNPNKIPEFRKVDVDLEPQDDFWFYEYSAAFKAHTIDADKARAEKTKGKL